MINVFSKKIKVEWLMFIGFFLFYLALGAYMSLERHYMPYDSLARMVSAYLVWFGKEMKLATIGFVWPPTPTMLILPFTLIPYLVDSWLAVVIVSALFMALACLAVNGLAKICKVPSAWRWLFVILFGLNPIMVVFGVNGMSEAVLVAITLAGFYWLTKFWQSDQNVELILAAGVMSLIALIRYEMMIIALASMVLIFIQTWVKGKQENLTDIANVVEGRLLAYSSMVFYPIFIWMVASWLIMGHPLYFLFNDRSAISLADMQLSGYIELKRDFVSALNVSMGVWVGVFPLCVLASLAAVLVGYKRNNPYLVGLGFLPFIIPLLQGFLLTQNATIPLLRYFIMVVPFGMIVAFATWYAFIPEVRGARATQNWIMGGVAVVFLISNVLSGMTLNNYRYQNIERLTWKALTTKEVIPNQAIEEAIQVGKKLAEIIPPGKRVLIDTFQFGFAIILGARNPSLFFDFTDNDYDQAVAHPEQYVDYLIIPKTVDRGIYYSINRAHPRLYEKGASWVEFMDVLPPTGLGWHLYRVIR